MLVFYCSMLESDSEKDRMAEIYEKYKLKFLKIALNITHNQALAEDAVHNTFVAIIKQKEKYFNLYGSDFLYSTVIIVRNKCIDLLRKEKQYSNIPMEELEIYIGSEDFSVEDHIVLSSEYEALLRYLERIDEISSQILIMKYEQGFSYKEIGERLNMTSSHVQTRIYRAKEKLKKLMREERSEEAWIKNK